MGDVFSKLWNWFMSLVPKTDAPGPFSPPNPVNESGAPDMPSALTIASVSSTDTSVTYEADWSSADRATDYEWWAGGNSDEWSENSEASPGTTGGATSVQFTAPRDPSVDVDSFFCVKATNDDGKSEQRCDGFTVPSQDSTGTAPDMPSTLTLSVTNVDDTTAEVTADWSSVDGADQYQWETAYNTGENTKGGSEEAPTTTTTVQMPRSGADEDCYFCVKAVNSFGESENRCDGYTLDAQPTSSAPTAPSDLTATAGDGYVELGWTDNSSNESGFRIYRDGTQVDEVGADVTSYTDDGRTNGTEYCYEVSAFNSDGESAKTSQQCATPQDSGATPDPAVSWNPDEYTSQSDFESDDNPWEFNNDGCDSGPCMELVSEGVPDLGTSQSIKYNHGDGEKRFGMTLEHPKAHEVWYEVWVKFSTNFKTNWGGDNNPDFKFLLSGIENPNQTTGKRWGHQVGVYGNSYTLYAPSYEGPDNEGSSSEEWDGEWHRWRLHYKNETSEGANDGVVEAWIASETGGRDLHMVATDIDTQREGGRIKSLRMGRNQNQLGDEIHNIWWGPTKVWTEDPGW